jgi:hypothetical protein
MTAAKPLTRSERKTIKAPEVKVNKFVQIIGEGTMMNLTLIVIR